jgi:hypothetical protein
MTPTHEENATLSASSIVADADFARRNGATSLALAIQTGKSLEKNT